jgi:hypothetical protein
MSDVGVEPNSMYPTLRFNVEFTNSNPSLVTLTNLAGRLFLQTPRYYIGVMTTDSPVLTISPSQSRTVTFYATIDYSGLATLERLRANQDLKLEAILSISSIPVLNQQNYTQLMGIPHRIPKSDWVETLLGGFQFKQTFLLELPRVNETPFKDTAVHLDEAMKKLAMGDYPEVLVQCQKPLRRPKRLPKGRAF